MSISAISGMLASTSANGQPVGLSELADISGSNNFQSLLIAAGKGNSLPADSLSADLQALFAGKVSAAAFDSAMAALLSGKPILPGDFSATGTGEPVQAAGEDGQSDTTEALLAAIAQAMSGQMSSTKSQLPTEQPGTLLTPDEASKLVASLMISPPIAPLNPSNIRHPTTDSGAGTLSDMTWSGNSVPFEVAPIKTSSASNPLSPNANGTPSPLSNVFVPRSTTSIDTENATSSALPSDANEGLPRPLSITIPVASNGTRDNLQGRQFENAQQSPESSATRTQSPPFADSISFPAALQGSSPGQLFKDSASPLREVNLEAANTAGTFTSPSPAAPFTAPQSRSSDVPASPAAINASLHDRTAWTQDFGDRIVWMAKQDQQSADIRITPANLGPVQITLNIEDGKANAVFVSPHAEVRQALEEALPRLREMLNAAGISLGQANVGSQMPQQQPDSTTRFASAPRNAGENAILNAIEGNGSSTSVSPIRQGRGMVDLFA